MLNARLLAPAAATEMTRARRTHLRTSASKQPRDAQDNRYGVGRGGDRASTQSRSCRDPGREGRDIWRFWPPSCRGWQRGGVNTEHGGHRGEGEAVRCRASTGRGQVGTDYRTESLVLVLAELGPAAGTREGSRHQDQWTVHLEEAEEPDSS